MKRILSCVLIVIVLLSLAACSKPTQPEPQVVQMRAICQLATLDCYYHNVAKFEQEVAGSFLWITWGKRFWMEYSGVVTVGIDASKVDLTINGDEVTITMPPATVLDCKVDPASLNKDSFILEQGSAAVNAEDETSTHSKAKEEMMKAASEDAALLANAQQRAKQLIENYVNNISESIGKQYTVKWVYITDEQIA